MRGTLNFKSLSHLSSNLVAALTSLNVNDFPHFAFFFSFLTLATKNSTCFGMDRVGTTVLSKGDFDLK